MKKNADKLSRAKEREIHVGDTVLVRQRKKNKFSSTFDPKPYRVTRVKGTMITATRPGHYITRNVSFCKEVSPQEEEATDEDYEEDYLSDDSMKEINDLNENEPLPERRYPQRNRRPVQRYGQNIYV